MSPQDAMMHLKNMHNGAADPYKDGPFPKGKNSKIGIMFIYYYNLITYLYNFIIENKLFNRMALYMQNKRIKEANFYLRITKL